jgi:RNA polymerase sigma-70 factor (ECF subfamily)
MAFSGDGKHTWSDPQLVAGVRRGDRECFDVLVHRHQREVRAVARAICAGAEESQDIAQEAFLRAWTNLDLLVDSSRFGAWVRRISSTSSCSSACLRWWRGT